MWPTSPVPTNEATIRQVAVLLCTRLVTPSPAATAGEAVAEAARQHLTQVFAEHAQHAGAHDVRAPHQQGDGGQQVEQMDHSRRFGVRGLQIQGRE
jgi:hypothetical protein